MSEQQKSLAVPVEKLVSLIGFKEIEIVTLKEQIVTLLERNNSLTKEIETLKSKG